MNLGNTYLGGEVEPQVTTSEAILDEKRNLLGEREAHCAREVCGLAEVDQVLKGECEGNRFAENDRDVLVRLINACVLADGNRTTADVTRAGELDAFLRCFDHN